MRRIGRSSGSSGGGNPHFLSPKRVRCARVLHKLLAISAIAILPFTAAACSRQPAMYPRVMYSGEYFGEDFLAAQKIVLVVEVTATEIVPGGATVRTPSRLTLTPVRVKAKVEGAFVADGTMPKGIEFYYFDDIQWGCRGSKWQRFGPGERWIVFLRRDGERLRTATDLCGVNFQVFSGRHKIDPKWYSRVTLGEAIAEILLTPGDGYNPEKFARRLEENWYTVQRLAGSRLILSKLLQFLKEAPLPVQETACLLLAKYYSFPSRCLQELALTVPLPAGVQAAEIAKVQRMNEPRVLAILEKRPMDFCRTGKVEDVIPEIEVMLEHPNPRIQAAARKALRGLQPGKY